jgi:hypothetical protein
MSIISQNLYTDQTKPYRDFLKQEIALKIKCGTKIILHGDQQCSHDATSDRINCVFNGVRLCSDKDRHSELEIQRQRVREWVRNTGTE